MKRRTFIAGIGSAVAWPLVAQARRSDRTRRIGVRMGYAENDPEAEACLTAFRQRLASLVVGTNRLRVIGSPHSESDHETHTQVVPGQEPRRSIREGSSANCAPSKGVRVVRWSPRPRGRTIARRQSVQPESGGSLRAIR
jgi:hypothetical protein